MARGDGFDEWDDDPAPDDPARQDRSPDGAEPDRATDPSTRGPVEYPTTQLPRDTAAPRPERLRPGRAQPPVGDQRREQSRRQVETRGPNLPPVQGRPPIRDEHPPTDGRPLAASHTERPPTGRPLRPARSQQPDPRARGGGRAATPYRESGYPVEQPSREQIGDRSPGRVDSDRDRYHRDEYGQGDDGRGYDQRGYDQRGDDQRGYDRSSDDRSSDDRSSDDRSSDDRAGDDRGPSDPAERHRRASNDRPRRVTRDEYDVGRDLRAAGQRPDSGREYRIAGRDQGYPERDRPERFQQRYPDQGGNEPDYAEQDADRRHDRQDYDRQDYDRQDYDRQDYDRQDYDQPDYDGQGNDEPGYDQPDYDRQDYGRQDYDRQDYDQPDYDRQDYDRQDPRSRAPDNRPLPAVGPRPPEPRGRHLPPYSEPDLIKRRPGGPVGDGPRKMTVARVAAFRGKELTNRGVQLFRRAATADGADQSGLTHLTYAVMANYAVDAALTVALANTLFFAAAAGESTGKVLLYLLITVAPFTVVAPFIGPLLDRVQNGRRIALAVCSFGRSVLAIIMAFNFDSWILYPCALGMMVLSKSFGVLKAALTPRVLPEQITLVKTNSRLTVFGLMAGGVSGAIAAAFAAMSNSSGALFWTALCGIAGGVLCIRIPSWVESTAGEVPVQHSEVLQRGKVRRFPPSVSSTLWANLANRIETGFLALFIAFVVKTEYSHVSGFNQLLLLGIVGAAAGAGGILGNALGARLHLHKPEVVAGIAVCCVALTTFVAMLVPGLAMGAVVGLVGSTSSSLAKVCLDSVIQDELPEVSRASAFGMSESALQLAWVGGGVVGLLLGGVLHLKGNPVYMLGFGVVTVLVVLALAQAWLARTSRALLPGVADLLQRRRSRAAGTSGSAAHAATAGASAGGADQRTTRLGGAPPTTPVSPQQRTTQPGDARGPARSASDSPRRGLRPRKAGKPR